MWWLAEFLLSKYTSIIHMSSFKILKNSVVPHAYVTAETSKSFIFFPPIVSSAKEKPHVKAGQQINWRNSTYKGDNTAVVQYYLVMHNSCFNTHKFYLVTYLI